MRAPKGQISITVGVTHDPEGANINNRGCNPRRNEQ
jgi:hypothetical protein